MDDEAGARLKDGERAVLLLGVGSLLVLALLQLFRRVDTVEIVATVLFILIFVAFVLFDMIGGGIAAAVATLMYLVLRLPAMDIVGSSAVTRLVVERAVAFAAFGLLGGYAHRILFRALYKLDEVDVIDDETGLSNARAFVRDLDYEIARSNRYKNAFSVALLDFAVEQFAGLKPKQRASVWSELGKMLRESVRNTDRSAVSRSSNGVRIVVLLSETDAAGAEIFTTRFAEKVSTFLLSRSVALPRKIGTAVSYPAEANEMRRLRNEIARVAGLPLSVDMARR